MQKLSWLDNLKKAEIPPIAPAPVTGHIDLHSDMFRIDAITTPAAKAVNDDGAENIPSAVDVLLKAEQNRKFRIREERRTRDPRIVKTTEDRPGVFAEWGEDGRIIRTYIEKREQPRESLYRIDPPSTEGYVSEDVAKLIGIGAGDQHPIEFTLRK